MLYKEKTPYEILNRFICQTTDMAEFLNAFFSIKMHNRYTIIKNQPEVPFQKY